MRLRTGDALVLVDIGAGGAQVESSRRLLPGALVIVQLAAADFRLSLEARVLRCSVCALGTPDGIRYRGALEFAEFAGECREKGS